MMDDDLLMSLENTLKQPSASFEDLIGVVERATLTIEGLKAVRERAMAAADRTSPYADRRAIGEAAHMYPSSVIRVLVRHGRPANRRRGK